jgi:hypothetical protein
MFLRSALAVAGPTPPVSDVPVVAAAEEVSKSVDLIGGLGLGALFAVFVGGLVTYGLERRRQRIDRRDAARNLASALQGELGALGGVAAARFLPFVTEAKGRVRSRKAFQPGLAATGTDHFRVYSALAGDLGLLPAPLPGQVTQAYLGLSMIVEDLQTLILPEWSERPRARQVLFLMNLESALRASTKECDNVAKALGAYAEGRSAASALPLVN